jgi:hypothetical protein
MVIYIVQLENYVNYLGVSHSKNKENNLSFQVYKIQGLPGNHLQRRGRYLAGFPGKLIDFGIVQPSRFDVQSGIRSEPKGCLVMSLKGLKNKGDK